MENNICIWHVLKDNPKGYTHKSDCGNFFIGYYKEENCPRCGKKIERVQDYEYIMMEKLVSPGKTGIWLVLNKSSQTKLGIIKWYGAWRQYCFYPEVEYQTIFSKGCLEDINSFIKMQMDERRKPCSTV